jgi:hypothetical protein
LIILLEVAAFGIDASLKPSRKVVDGAVGHLLVEVSGRSFESTNEFFDGLFDR